MQAKTKTISNTTSVRILKEETSSQSDDWSLVATVRLRGIIAALPGGLYGEIHLPHPVTRDGHAFVMHTPTQLTWDTSRDRYGFSIFGLGIGVARRPTNANSLSACRSLFDAS